MAKKKTGSNRLRLWAELKGLNNAQLAKLLNVTRRTSRALVLGTRKDILLSTAHRITEITNLAPSDYLGIK